MIFYKNVLQPAYLSPQINYKMKKLNDTAITVLAIVSTILSYPSWLPVVLVGNLFSSLAPAIYYIIFLVFSLALFFACKSLYRFYNRTESARAALWGQIGFIFLVSFTIKFIFDNLLLLPGSLWGGRSNIWYRSYCSRSDLCFCEPENRTSKNTLTFRRVVDSGIALAVAGA